MSKSQQDQFIDDDEEETCPLCVEEFDLGDKGFRPCPCGYQICQFCYNSIKTNMNGLCPACRRPYSDKDIEYKIITPEESAAHKARQAQKQKKTQAALQKEKQKAEADNLSRKHLAGLRVVQKNLVYVTGLNPSSQEDQLLQTLRGDSYFGQYGKIIKIVVSKAKDPLHPQSVGVYVTYERKEDAESCIAAVNGTNNGGHILRAQCGTTKYCSAYLRGENCTNRNCMFLHEPGEANESYSRADLSALNAGSSQHGSGRAPPPQSQQPVASASQPMARQSSSDRPQSPAVDRPALPSTASWASRPSQAQPSQTQSRSTSGTIESDGMTAQVAPAPPTQPTSQPEQPTQSREQPIPAHAPSENPIQTVPQQQKSRKARDPFASLVLDFKPEHLKFNFGFPSTMSEADIEIIKNYPPLFDPNGGAKRRLRREREEEQRRMQQEALAFQQSPGLDMDENLEMSGSLQLGGEPEERQPLSQPHSAIQPPGPDGLLDQRFQFGGISSPVTSDRGLTPQQHQQYLLQTMKSPNAQSPFLNNMNPPTSFQQSSNPPGHQRNASRYSFANESTASTAVKPVANAKLLNQQSSIMPPAVTGGNNFGAQPHGNQFFTSNVQGPPPGLKTTGTPPVSGGMTFGQGHGFATGGIQYGALANSATGRNANEEMMRNLLRGGRDAPTPTDVAAKHDADFPPLGPPSRQQSISNINDIRRSTPPVPPGFSAHPAPFARNESRPSTPKLPPGIAIGKPTALPDLEGGTGLRPASRASVKRTTSHVLPALPLRPATPAPLAQRPKTPTPKASLEDVKTLAAGPADQELETPTRPPKATVAGRDTIAVPERRAVVPGPAKSEAPKEAEVSIATGVAEKVEPTVAAAEDQAPTEVEKEAFSKPSQKAALVAPQPGPKVQAPSQNIHAKDVPFTPSKPGPLAQEKKHPGKLDITAAVQKREAVASSSATPTETVPLSATSRLESPATSTPPPAVKSAPRTLRVVPTPKTETPPPAPMPTTKEPAPAVSGRFPSRQPSIASINPPETPSSEQVSISDTVSMTSTSHSRANSPPPAGPSKVGAAPVKAKTKNQLRKERQERAKAIEEEKSKTEEVVKSAAEPLGEPAQEAIVSRKKKEKKAKEPKVRARETKTSAPTTTGESTPTASRPVSPQPKPVAVATPTSELPAKEIKPVKPSTPTPAPAAQPRPMQSPHEPSPPPTPTLTTAQLIAELKATAPEIQRCIDSLFRSPTSNHHKPNQNISHKDLANPASWKQDFKLNLTKDEVDALLKGKVPAVRYGGEEGRIWDRGMVTPAGVHLRALTEELELRFLELEKAIRELPDELRFRPSKPQNEMKFPSVDLEALKRQFENIGGRGVSVMEQMVQDGSTMKKGAFLVDEASKYINEFVMPPATPPPSAADHKFGGQAATASTGPGVMGGVGGERAVPSAEIAERQLHEARRVADERDNALKKMVKKNKRLFGLS